MRGIWIELGTVRIFEIEHIARKFDDGNLHAEAQSQVRNMIAAGVASGFNLALNATVTKPTWHNNARYVFKRLAIAISHLLKCFGVDPFNAYIYIMMPASMMECF